MNQNYKVAIQHAINQNQCQAMSDFEQFALEQIHKVDYLQPWGELDSDFALEKSYTWLDWLIIEEAIQDPKFDLK